MKFAGILLLLAGVDVWADAVENVNSRYTIESVELSGGNRSKLSTEMRDELDRLVGQKFDPEVSRQIAGRLRKQLRASDVTHRLEKGEKPDYVKLVFESHRKHRDSDAQVTKLAYHSRNGWTGALQSRARAGVLTAEFGIESDADELLERNAGFNVGASAGIGEHVQVRFTYEAFHQKWNAATVTALENDPAVPGIYRERFNYQPTVTIQLPGSLTVTAGMSFQEFQTQFPVARTEAANAAIGTLRYRGRWSGPGLSRQEMDTGYSLRAATNSLDSDFVYARHLWSAQYTYRYDEHALVIRALAGRISGIAPLFERFVLGNTSTLRGWNKFDVAPLGGSRSIHGSAEYRYDNLMVFYDAGSVWDRGETIVARHSVGGGIRSHNLAIGVGFPVNRDGVAPVYFIALYF
ncbi:MAG: BamA/TamA family outer membrane protein [Acidobacteria bacterium]|nr:BamA/TamA family outer membrane protein [Acidobacteriota bacterium]MBI3278687.1 BamA/TamA family outer membrane protein [Acidobacteriota bacterium]